jgi:hypothetical protein
MKRLFALEFARFSKQTSAWVILSLILFLGAFNVFLAQVSVFEGFEGEIIRSFTARSIIESSFQLSQFQVLLIGVLTSLFIANDIAQGTIRNKLIAGYSKTEIYLVQMGMSILITIFGLFLYHALPLAFSWLITFPITQDDQGTLANFLILMGFGYGLVILAVVFTTWISLKAKNTAGAIIFTILIFILGPTLMTIIKSIVEGLVLVNIDQFENLEAFELAQQQINGIFEWIYFYQIQRINGPVSIFDFLFGDRGINFFNPDNQAFIWKTIVTTVASFALFIGLGARGFAKSDLR